MTQIAKETSLVAGLKAVGLDSPKSRLYLSAVKYLKRSKGDAFIARDRFVGEVVRGAELLVELMGGRERIAEAALGYLRSIANDMNRTSAGGGQEIGDTQNRAAPAAPATEREEEDRGISGAQLSSVPSSRPSRNEAGHPGPDAPSILARPVREPNQTERASALRAAKAVAESVYDTFKITDRQGSRLAVGDVLASRWASIAKHTGKRAWVGGRESELAIILDAYVSKQAHVPDDAKTRDIVPKDVLEAAIAEAAKVADYQRRISSIVQEAAHGA